MARLQLSDILLQLGPDILRYLRAADLGCGGPRRRRADAAPRQQSERGAQWQEEAELGRKGREEKGREQSWMNRREGRYVVILPPDSSASGQLGERQLERAKSKKAELEEGGAEERTSCRWRA